MPWIAPGNRPGAPRAAQYFIAQAVAAIVESGAAADTLTETAQLALTVSEAGAAADTVTTTGISVNVAESGAAADTVTETVQLALSVAESGAAADAPQIPGQGQGQWIAPSNRPGALRAAHYFLAASGPIAVSVAESGAAADTVTETAQLALSVAESGAAADTVQSNSITVGITESGAATDGPGETGRFGLTQAESGLATDGWAVPGAGIGTMAEQGAAQESWSAAVRSPQPSPYYDLLAIFAQCAPGVVLTAEIDAALHLAYQQNGYQPLTCAQVLAVVLPLIPDGNPPEYTLGAPTWPPPTPQPGATPTFTAELPAQPTQTTAQIVGDVPPGRGVALFPWGLPRFKDSNPTPLDDWAIDNEADFGEP